MTNDKDSAVRQANREWEVSDFYDDREMANWARAWGVDLLEAATTGQPTQSDALLEGDTQTILYLLGVRHGREDERAKIAAETSQPTQSDALREENERLREHLISALDTLKDAEVCDDNCGPCNEARAAL